MTERKGRARAGAQWEAEEARRVQEVTQRAIRRLDLLEWVMWVGGIVLAVAGGGVVAAFVSAIAGWPFRLAWIGASLLLFVVPGSIALVMLRMEERRHAASQREGDRRDDG